MSAASSEEDIHSLVATINHDGDRLHVDLTPSVQKLSTLGLPAARAVLDLMNDSSQVTRMRAFRVLGHVVMRHCGWEPVHGYPNPGQEEEIRLLMVANGDYRPEADLASRQESIAKWGRWLDQESADG